MLSYIDVPNKSLLTSFNPYLGYDSYQVYKSIYLLVRPTLSSVITSIWYL